MRKDNIDYNLIKKYCGQDLSFRLQGAINHLNDTEMTIVNTGMVSSGKSSLYNILTENIEQERFPTGAARTTTIADSYHYKDLVYIDTPGIDVKDIDDEVAFSTIMEADIVLITHNIKTGPLTRAESEWIKRISEAMPTDEIRKKRMIFVCTWKDMREKEDGYREFYEEVCRMAFDAAGTEINTCDVSVLKYQNGIKKDKPLLCEKSGIIELRDLIDRMAGDYASEKENYARETYNAVACEVADILQDIKKQKRNAVVQKQKKVSQRFISERNKWIDIFNYFSSRRYGLDELQRELDNM